MNIQLVIQQHVARSPLWALTLLLVAWSPVLAAQPEFFPFSVWYSGGVARAPMLEPVDPGSRERWSRDLQQIRSLGFNTVRTWVEWTANEPRPGSYDFRNLELLLDLARESGLKVMIQVYTDSAPDWVGDRWEDARFVAQSGTAVTSQSAPGYCFDHPEVRAKVLDFYRETARRAAPSPNFLGWDLWSEPHIINWAILDYLPNATFCYCPSSIERFRGWLEKKYGTLAALNLAWYRTFTEWRQVEPPRFGTILTYTDFIDWRLYIREKLAEDLKSRAEAVRAVDPTKVTTSHAAVPGLFTSPLWGVGAPDDWLMADAVDYWGTSIYPKHSFPQRHWSLLTLTSMMDFIRSSGRSKPGFYVGELQAGMGIRGTVVGDPVSGADQRLWVLGMLSRGARAINVYAYYPMSSGYEAGGYGLVRLDGTVTERAREMGRLAALVDRHQDLFLSAVPEPAEVAVIYNPLSYLVGGEQHLSESGAVRESLQGFYRAFWKLNIPVDFVHWQEVEQGALDSYRLVVLPYPLMLTSQGARNLSDFVRAGGILIAEARCGWNDARGFAQPVIPGFGLDEVLGVRESSLKMQDEVGITLSSVPPEWTGLQPGDRLPGVGIAEELQPAEGTQVLGRFDDGSAALTIHAWGRGKAITLGTFMGIANSRADDEKVRSLLGSLAGASGCRPALGVEGAAAEIRVLETGSGRLVYLFNHSSESVQLSLPVSSAVDLESGQPVRPEALRLEGGEITILRVN